MNKSRREESSHPINPVNLLAEQCVLGALIEEGSLLPDVLEAGLRTEDFSLADNRRVFDAILKLSGERKPIDYLLVAEGLGNRAEDYALVGSLIQGVILHDKNHTIHHVAIVRQKSRLRTLLRIGEWLEHAVTDAADPDELIAEANRRLEALAIVELAK